MPTSPTTDARRRGDPQAGFSLMELMLALAVIALVAAVALPKSGFSAGPAVVRAKAYEAAALLRADRTEALRTRRTVETRFDAVAGVLRSGASHDTVTLPAAVSARFEGRGAGIRFYADGKSSGGLLAFASRSVTLDVRVDDFTSAVEIRGRSGDAR